MKFLYLQDLILTPLYLGLLSALVLRFRNQIQLPVLRPYFLPAFGYKMLGAIMLGLIYQFYYGGGDTGYYYRDGKFITDQSLDTALMLIFRSMDYIEPRFSRTYALVYFGDGPSYMISRLSGFFSLLSFQTYTVNAMFFATYSFAGSWYLFRAVTDRYPHLHRNIAIATLFLPSTFFWGAGLLKDSMTFGALGFVFFHFYFALIRREKLIPNLILMGVHALLLMSIKSYIFQLLAPAMALWAYLRFQKQIPGAATRFILLVLQVIVFGALSYFAFRSIGEDLVARLDQVGERAKITAEWIHTVSDEGSSYYLGELDGTFSGMLRFLPQAVGTALFRPGLWEVSNPLMLLAALENTVLLWFILRLFWKIRLTRLIGYFQKDTFLLFSLVFTILFSFLVGITSSNFGTLVRYKIPMLPFFVSTILILTSYTSKRNEVQPPASRSASASEQETGREKQAAAPRGYVRMRDRAKGRQGTRLP